MRMSLGWLQMHQVNPGKLDGFLGRNIHGLLYWIAMHIRYVTLHLILYHYTNFFRLILSLVTFFDASPNLSNTLRWQRNSSHG